MIKEKLVNVLKNRFPTGIDSSFAYGSAVFGQKGDPLFRRNMIDMVLVVDNPQQWHAENIERNPKDYSLIRYLGSKMVSYIGNGTSVGIMYNPMVKYEDVSLKYGVISKGKLLDDLTNWNYFFLAGRLQKPVLWLKHSNVVDQALQLNLQYALCVALLLQPQEFKENQLYRDLCSLSYDGDIRTWFGVDSNKPNRIVDTNMNHFRKLYLPVLNRFSHVKFDLKSGQLFKDSKFNKGIFEKLPRPLIGSLQQNFHAKDMKELYRVESNRLNEAVRNTLRSTVLRTSTVEAIKAFFTTSLIKSIVYSKEKFRKSVLFKNSHLHP